MTYPTTNEDHAHEYLAAQLDLTDYWSLDADYQVHEPHPDVPWLALNYWRQQTGAACGYTLAGRMIASWHNNNLWR